MSWLPTSPHGPLRNASWACADCPARSSGDPYSAAVGDLRADAIAHLEGTGHTVGIAHGTLETLYPMATTTPAGR